MTYTSTRPSHSPPSKAVVVPATATSPLVTGGVARSARSVSTGLAARYRQAPEPGAIPSARIVPIPIAPSLP